MKIKLKNVLIKFIVIYGDPIEFQLLVVHFIFFTIVDDCSHDIWIHLLNGKNEVGSVLKKFMAMIQ